MRDSKFLCLEYESSAELKKNDTDSWEGDRSFNTGNITTMGKIEGGNWTSDIHGI